MSQEKEADPKVVAAQALKRQASKEVNPITGMSGTQVATARWYAAHRLLLRKIALGFLIAVDVALVGYALYGWGTYAVYGYWKERAMLRDMATQHVPYQAYRERTAPAAVESGEALLLDSGTKAGWNDILASAQNPNERWVANVTYHFEDGEEKTGSETATILPGESTYLGVLGFAASTTISSPAFVIDDTAWQRVPMYRAPDVAEYLAARLDFTVVSTTVTRPDTVKGVRSYQIAFDITNNTIHSYWSVPFWVLLYSGNTVVGVEQATVSPFERGETAHVDVRSLVRRTVTRAEVIPRLNVFDESVYKTVDSAP